MINTQSGGDDDIVQVAVEEPVVYKTIPQMEKRLPN